MTMRERERAAFKKEFNDYMKWLGLFEKLASRHAKELMEKAEEYDSQGEITHGRLSGVKEALADLGRATEF